MLFLFSLFYHMVFRSPPSLPLSAPPLIKKRDLRFNNNLLIRATSARKRQMFYIVAVVARKFTVKKMFLESFFLLFFQHKVRHTQKTNHQSVLVPKPILLWILMKTLQTDLDSFNPNLLCLKFSFENWIFPFFVLGYTFGKE